MDHKALAKIKAKWLKVIKPISDFSYDDYRNKLRNISYIKSIPEDLLTHEGYINVAGSLQGTRNGLIAIKIEIDELAQLLAAAYKNMSDILPGLADGTAQQKKSEAEKELQSLKIKATQLEVLQKTSDTLLSNIDSAIAQLNRQLKAADLGYRTAALDFSKAKDWKNDDIESIDEVDEEYNF